MPSIEHARSLVCGECWRLLFNTESYKTLCAVSNPSEYPRLTYVTSRAFLARKESDRCSWCQLLRLLINYICPPEGPEDPFDFKSCRLSISTSVLSTNLESQSVGPNYLSLQLYVNNDEVDDLGCTADEWKDEYDDFKKGSDSHYESSCFYDYEASDQSGVGKPQNSSPVDEKSDCRKDDEYEPGVTDYKEGRASDSENIDIETSEDLESSNSGQRCTFAGFYTYAPSSDPAAQFVTARPIQQDASPAATREQIRSWMQQCNHHTCCPLQQDTQLPKRLVYLGSSDNNIKLVESRKSSSVGKYAALSYCWGSASTYVLTKTNIQRFKVALETKAMPRSIQDAITVARTIPVDYLWVDALCIIQDSAEDKGVEIDKMQSIYSNALVTIVAANSSDASQGFLKTRPLSTRTFHHSETDQLCLLRPDEVLRIPFRMAEDDFGTISLQCKDCLTQNLDGQSEPINQRAWTLQEQLLAPRVLTYTNNTLHWRCREGIKQAGDCLCGIEYTYWTKLLRLSRSSVEAFSNDWLGMIEIFSRRKLSCPEDKLPAIAGLAKAFSNRFGPGYWAGIWEQGGLRQLQWVVSHSSTEKLPLKYRAPSWSWASTDGEVSYEHAGPGQTPLAQNLHVMAPPISTKNPFGGVSGGHIKLRGKTRQAFLVYVGNRKGQRIGSEENKQSTSKYWPFGIVWRSDKIDSLAAAEANLQTRKPVWNTFDDERSCLYLDASEYRKPGLVTCVLLFNSFGLILREIPSRRRTRKTFQRIGAVAHCIVGRNFLDAIDEEIVIA